MTDMISVKEKNQTCEPWDSQENKKNAVSISIAFSIDVLIRNENIASDECNTKNRLK